ncbi:MAG: hypothetical protein MUW56_18745 [Chryseobacterium sp.]|uniref:hypothetical protein n=1 Tax=Chryseobacterium sp. TaxID=1871047 RepID=UPI0025BD9432|nr:hypothetical protein [Chryseobacterium sp.]MCJ7935602.1 hypothetical protein [Chryseobacterium sp.]
MLPTPLSYPDKKNLTYPSLTLNNEQFCAFLAGLDYNELQFRYRKVLEQYKLKKDYQNDLLKIKKELENKKFFASSNGEALLYLMTISKTLSKMTLELIPEAKLLSTIQNYIYDIIDAVFGSKNMEPNDFEVPSHIKDQYVDLLGKYQPLYVIADNMNQLIQDTIKNEGEVKAFINDYKNLMKNLENQVNGCSSQLKMMENDMDSIKSLKDSINRYRTENCSGNIPLS